MKLKEHPEQVTWVDSTLAETCRFYGSEPAVDKLRVTEAMRPGWRYREEEGVPCERYLGAIQTSAWFTIDSGAMSGIMAGADPAIDELPPLPFSRIAIDGWYEKRGNVGTLFGFQLHRSEEPSSMAYSPDPELLDLESMISSSDRVFGCASMVIFEITQGKLWDVLVELRSIGESRGTVMRMGFHLTPGGHTADYDALQRLMNWKPEAIEFDRLFGQLVWKCAVSAAHMITAVNVKVRRLHPGRKQMKAWSRQRFAPVEARIYRVDLETSKRVVGEGLGERVYRCRWMVRGHYRHTPHGPFYHPRDGMPASWIPAHIKGPVGAPWKGKPNYTMKVTA